MKEYIAVKKFHLGELTKDIAKDERIQFDGTTAIIRGEKVRAPTLMRCVGTLLQEALTDSSGKAIERTTPVNIETPQQRSARLRQERLQQIRGSAGNGEFLEDTNMTAADKKLPRKVQPLDQGAKVVERKSAKDPLDIKATIIDSHSVDVKTSADSRSVKMAAAAEKSKKKTHSKEVLTENDGRIVATIKTGVVEQEADPKGFHESLLDGKPKKLEISKDQFVPKRPVVKLDSQDEAVEIKRLVGADEITPSSDPLKDWSKMNATKKENFLKKATDTAVIKKIIERETGGVKRKAEERLANLDGDKGLG